MVMVRKQTLVQLSDDLLDRLDRYSSRHRRSRSEVMRAAVRRASSRATPQSRCSTPCSWHLRREPSGAFPPRSGSAARTAWPGECALSFDNLTTVPKGLLTERITALTGARRC